MAEDCKELKNFYDKIFSWNYLLKFGYYDFIENYNKKIDKIYLLNVSCTH